MIRRNARLGRQVTPHRRILYIFGPHQPLPQDIEETCSKYSEKARQIDTSGIDFSATC